jgi:hypothetical protein
MRDVKTGNKEVLQNLQKTNPELFTDDNKDLTYNNTPIGKVVAIDTDNKRLITIQLGVYDSIPTDDDIPADRETKISNERNM